MLSMVRHAFRRLRSEPAAPLNAVACLAIAVWLTCVVSEVSRAFLWPDLGIANPSEVIQIDEDGLFTVTYPRLTGGRSAPTRRFAWRIVSKAVVDSLAARKIFAAIGYYAQDLGGRALEGDRRPLWAIGMSSGIMDVLGVLPVVGRRFVPSDDSTPSLMISERLWRTRFGRDTAILGHPLRLQNGNNIAEVPIVGVMPSSMNVPYGTTRPDLFLSAGFESVREFPARAVLARLRPGTSIDQLRPVIDGLTMRHVISDREALYRYWQAKDPRHQPSELLPVGVRVEISRYYREPLGAQTLKLLLLLLACGCSVVVIASTNVASLLLVRATARRQEMAIRAALGASRLRILCDLSLEVGLLAVIGVTAGFVLAFWQWNAFGQFYDGRMILGRPDTITIMVASGTGLVVSLAGLVPGLSGGGFSHILQSGGVRGLSLGVRNGMSRIVASAVSMTVVVAVCAGVLYQSARGWVDENVIGDRDASVSVLTLDGSQSRSRRSQIALEAVRRVRALPDIRFAVLGAPPTAGLPTDVEAVSDGASSTRMQVNQFAVSDGYFAAMGIKLVAGRSFTPEEVTDSSSVIVISSSIANRLLQDQPVLGRRLRYWIRPDSIVYTGVIVGVSEALSSGSKQLYVPFGTKAETPVTLLVASNSGRRLDAAAVSRAIRGLPGLMSSDFLPAGLHAQPVWWFARLLLTGFAAFSAIGLTLAAIGIYGVISYVVERRRREIGIRIALGASKTRVVGMILEEAFKTTAGGAAVGVALSLAASRLLAAVISDTRLEYAVIMGGVLALLALTTVVAAVIPAFQAANLDPSVTLRSD
jgi:predicted permease